MSMSGTDTLPIAKGVGSDAFVITANGIRLPRPTSGPVLDLDLATMVEQLWHDGMWSDGRNSRTLVKHGDFRMILTVMKAGAHLRRHHARGTVLIQVLSGHIRARIMDETVDAPVGHALSLDPNLEHEVEAVDESALLITIAWPQGFGIARKEPAMQLASLSAIADRVDAAARPESGNC